MCTSSLISHFVFVIKGYRRNRVHFDCNWSRVYPARPNFCKRKRYHYNIFREDAIRRKSGRGTENRLHKTIDCCILYSMFNCLNRPEIFKSLYVFMYWYYFYLSHINFEMTLCNVKWCLTCDLMLLTKDIYFYVIYLNVYCCQQQMCVLWSSIKPQSKSLSGLQTIDKKTF